MKCTETIRYEHYTTFLLEASIAFVPILQLEPGEIDPVRFKAFTSCITRNSRARKARERKERIAAREQP